jgi:hypothetical protein
MWFILLLLATHILLSIHTFLPFFLIIIGDRFDHQRRGGGLGNGALR